jgi:hypothetical protein
MSQAVDDGCRYSCSSYIAICLDHIDWISTEEYLLAES